MDKIYQNEFYGDSFRWFIGVVEDIRDPLKLGRVRVRVRGIHSFKQEDIDTADLPWAQVILPSTEAGISGIGRSSGLLPGAEVIGFFFDADGSQLPVVIGAIAKIEYASYTQQQDFSSPSLNRLPQPSSAPQGTGTTGERNKIEPSTFEGLGGAGNSHPEIAYNYFVTYGFTPEQAAGIVGNLMQESGAKMSTTIKSAGSEQSYGIAQWNSAAAAGNRLGLLKEFAKDLGKDWTELEVQLRFITYELETFPYLGLASLRAAKTVEQATIAFETKYERPSDPNRSGRIAYAQDVYKRFA